MNSWRVVEGDALERLRELPDRSVQTCVTSPPYFGLRDYGTSSWEGGDEGCDHVQTRNLKRDTSGGMLPAGEGTRGTQSSTSSSAIQYRDVCGKCGATRTDSQLGLESTPDEYVARLVEVFREVRRVLRDDGTLWLNLGDSYAAGGGSGAQRLDELGDRLGTGGGHKHSSCDSGRAPTPPDCKPKDLLGIPWLVAFALRADGWYLRSDIIWAKPNPMPESVTDRPTKAHEYVFLLSKSPRYFYDADAIREPHEGVMTERRLAVGMEQQGPKHDGRAEAGLESGTGWGGLNPVGRNKRSVWTVATQPFSWRKNARRVRVEPGDVTDDTERITSRDCPVHGDRAAPASTGSSDGHAGPQSSDSASTDSRHAQGLLDGFAPTDPHPVPHSEAGSSDSPDPVRADSATPHNTRSHRTDHDPATSPACTPSAETSPRTGGTSGPPGSAEPCPDTLESRTSSGELADHPPSGTTVGTVHKSVQQESSACTCEHYRLETTDHFAVFPPNLIEPCVLAGSAESACGVCGAPWERVVERETEYDGKAVDGYGAEAHWNLQGAQGRGPKGNFGVAHSNTLGWRASCSCACVCGHAEETHTVEGACSIPECPCICFERDDKGTSTVLDPFAGAGTTGLVATRHNRSFIGIELNPEYAEMARDRIRDDAPLMNYIIEDA